PPTADHTEYAPLFPSTPLFGSRLAGAYEGTRVQAVGLDDRGDGGAVPGGQRRDRVAAGHAVAHDGGCGLRGGRRRAALRARARDRERLADADRVTPVEAVGLADGSDGDRKSDV